MQEYQQSMAIVEDEHNKMLGIITVEDIVEHIVGNIYDEFDKKDK